MEVDHLAALRGILTGHPSAERWERLLALFRSWPVGSHDLETGVDYAMQHLVEWDDALRVISQQELSAAFGRLGRFLQYDWFEPVVLSSLLHVEAFRGLSILRLCVTSEQINELLSSNCLPSPRVLSLDGSELVPDDLRRVLASALSASVEELSLADTSLEETELPYLLNAPCFGQLKELDLSHNYLDDTAMRALAQEPGCEGLEWLSVRYNPIGDVGVQALASSPYLGRLQTLLIDPPPGTWLGAQGLLSLLYSPELASLRKLSCVCYVPPDNTDPEGDEQCLGSLYVPRAFWEQWPEDVLSSRGSLETFLLNDVVIDLRILQYILDAPAMRGIRKFSLSGSPIGNEGLERLIEHPHAFSLRSLELSDCGIGDSGLLRLAVSTHLPELEVLVLQDNFFGEGGSDMAQDALLALAQSPHYEKLEVLDLTGNIVPESTLFAFLESSTLPRLKELYVSAGEWAFDNDVQERLLAFSKQGRRVYY